MMIIWKLGEIMQFQWEIKVAWIYEVWVFLFSKYL